MGIALKLYQNEQSNAKYQAMLILAAIHSSPADMDLAAQICAKMKVKNDAKKMGMDEFANIDIPKKPSFEIEDGRVFDFENDGEMEMRKKRQAYQRKRGKVANKLRAKYKQNPSLFKEPIDWKSDKNEKGSKGKEEEKNNN